MDWQSVSDRMADELGAYRKGSAWAARCPAHDDEYPSLEWTIRGDTLVFRCQAGCEQKVVLDKLIEMGLWPKRGEMEITQIATEANRVASYGYQTEDGTGIFKHRFETTIDGKTRKTFRWGMEIDDFQRGIGDRHPLLYRHDVLVAKPDLPVVLVEGEKCVQAGMLATPNYVFVCKPTNKTDDWAKWANELRGRRVIILPDNDPTGFKNLGEALYALRDVAASVTWVELPGLPEKGDLVDWLQNHAPDELEALLGNRANHLTESPVPAGDQPHNVEAERRVIGATINLGYEALESIRLSPADFFVPAHQTLWSALLDLYEHGKVVDGLSLTDYLRARELFQKVGGSTYCETLATMDQDLQSAIGAAAIVRDRAIQRKLLGFSERVAVIGRDASLEPDTALQRVWSDLEGITASGRAGEFTDLAEVMERVRVALAEASERDGTFIGLDLGFEELNMYTSGAQKGDMIVVAARPSMGKTALGVNIAHAVADRTNTPVAFFEMEMNETLMGQRFVALDAEVDANALRNGRLDEAQAERVSTAMKKLAHLPVYLDCTPGTSIMELKAKAKRMAREKNIGFLVVDYIGLMLQGQPNEVAEMSSISRQIKGLARELNIPVLVLSQLSRKTESRQDHRPWMSDLRSSGSIEQDADVVMLLYRDDYYNQNSDEPGIVEIDIAKNRNGPTGMTKLYFDKSCMKFRDLQTGDLPAVPPSLQTLAAVNPFAAVEMATLNPGAGLDELFEEGPIL